MVVQIILNHERVGGHTQHVWCIDTSLLRNYKPIGNNMPHNIIDMLENENYMTSMDGAIDKMVLTSNMQVNADWYEEEEEEMIKQRVITFNVPIDKEFEICYC
jgi:hypothetical protein